MAVSQPAHTFLHTRSCTCAPAVDTGHVLSVVCGIAANRLERDFGGRVLLPSESSVMTLFSGLWIRFSPAFGHRQLTVWALSVLPWLCDCAICCGG